MAEQKFASLYEATRKIYPRAIDGHFARLRWAMVFITQLMFYGMPWWQWGERQAVLFDLSARRFYLLGLVLYPQDLIYLSGLLVISALALFLFTALAGRLWCGYSCPQTVYTEIFQWVEQQIEGNRGARMKLDDETMSADKLVKKTFKHIVWLGIALWTGFTFVGYFTPIRDLGLAFLQTRMGSWEVFWVFFYALATYGNAGFMREQVCKYMCPYARFQSAMFDRDTLIVGYDVARGEPRAPLGKQIATAAFRTGDCIDCKLCVQVCPTGIDIRKGLQYECISCGLCADGCDTVMRKLDRPTGLIRYDAMKVLEASARVEPGVPTHATKAAATVRPRIWIYSALLSVLIVAMATSLFLRTPLKVDVVRDRASLARFADDGRIENVYRLQVMNATEVKRHYRISAAGLDALQVASDPDVDVGPAESRWVAVRLQVPAEGLPPGSHPVKLLVSDINSSARVTESAAFIVPR